MRSGRFIRPWQIVRSGTGAGPSSDRRQRAGLDADLVAVRGEEAGRVRGEGHAALVVGRLARDADAEPRPAFGDGRARYETADRDHHDHFIDIATGEVIEFMDEEIEALQERIAERLGFELRGHRLELYGVRRKAPK